MNSFAPLYLATLAAGLAAASLPAAPAYTIVDTAQTRCYNNRGVIAAPKPGEPFYGQDAQFQAHPPHYTLGTDGLTVQDHQTGLTWQRSPDTDGDGALTRRDKLTRSQAQALPARLNNAKFGGFRDWRLPSIKELYSLFEACGTDPSGPSDPDTSKLRPFIDTTFFKFAYGDTRTGERVIDSQYATSTQYVGRGARGYDKLFGVNFADGRIKGYDLFMPGGGMQKTFFVICVRGNPSYGTNDFHDNGDGTISDRATELTWSKADSGHGLNWQDALAWAQKKNAERFLGHDDWRVPSVKELQSIVDYSRSPDTTHSPAIDPLFECTCFTNEAHQADYPFYWSATTHAGFMGGGAAMYVAFGRAAGWMSARSMAGGPPERRGGFGPGPGEASGAGAQEAGGGDYHYVDVHGAGAQRSDPKAGDPALFPHGRGPQGDVIRIYNYVRLVRGGNVTKSTSVATTEPETMLPVDAPPEDRPPGGLGGPAGPGGFHLLPPLAMQRLKLAADQRTRLTALDAEAQAALEKILTPDQMEQLHQMRPPMPEGSPGGFGGPGGQGGRQRPPQE